MSTGTLPPERAGTSIVGPEPAPPARPPARPSNPGCGEISPRTDQPLRSLGSMLDVFADTATALAASSDRMASTSATPEQVDLVADLGELARAILDHNQRVLMGDDVDWARLAERLAAAADRCRRQLVIQVTHVGDSGRTSRGML